MTENVENSLSNKMTSLSTSTSSFEPMISHDPRLNELATNMFKKTADYLIGELSSTQADYEVLEKMNNATITKYSDMKQITVNISNSIEEQNQRYKQLIPQLEQIDQIYDSVLKLEQAAYKLDHYAKRLEAKFKQLEKQ
ncbi:biogenesis of lysosome-related organelles complex 1 subunit 2-like [Diaphorina citri]|uniref:Biogenesis of lysosome-related organelles complex 1 subunit 2-like n=2 Tax=Diaphorina citri TaxID=121845 RepID=A0A1S3DKI4_DIACI|nr:biogenesis of lysosome-related organelles complex 1 subunit 2-like [Diaphorina citri]KAI5721474.1 hypothetical protein M8J77_021250 [Diaphorina citri]